MLQIVRRLSGILAACTSCEGQPIHVHVRGRDSHFLECPRCAIRTRQHETITAAIADWEHRNTEPAPVAAPKTNVFSIARVGK
jgi:hypothetical protein